MAIEPASQAFNIKSHSIFPFIQGFQEDYGLLHNVTFNENANTKNNYTFIWTCYDADYKNSEFCTASNYIMLIETSQTESGAL